MKRGTKYQDLLDRRWPGANLSLLITIYPIPNQIVIGDSNILIASHEHLKQI